MVPRPTEIPDSLSAEQEATFYRSLSFAQRAELLAAACRAAAALLRAHPHPERAASYVDPLPESTIQALARLRAEARSRSSRTRSSGTSG